jgi:transposase-like protein
MGFTPYIWRFRSAERARVLLICPHCGQETPEYAAKLRGLTDYRCRGENCDYRFALAAASDAGDAGQLAETRAK